jgi:hypothetical protein
MPRAGARELPGHRAGAHPILDVPGDIQAPAAMVVTVESAGGVPAPAIEPFLVTSVEGS